MFSCQLREDGYLSAFIYLGLACFPWDKQDHLKCCSMAEPSRMIRERGNSESLTFIGRIVIIAKSVTFYCVMVEGEFFFRPGLGLCTIRVKYTEQNRRLS